VCPSEDYPGLVSKELPSPAEGHNYFDNFSSDGDSEAGDENDADDDDQEF
jgi:hypothetical protein